MTQITVPDVPTEKTYFSIAATVGPFIVPFAFFDEDDVFIQVTTKLTDVTLVHSTDFTFNVLTVPVGQEGNGYEGGEITLNVAVGDGTTENAATIRIYRDTVIDRTANYTATGPFNIPVMNDEQNKFVMMMQEMAADINSDQVALNTVDIAQNASDIANLTANDPGGSYALLNDLISTINGEGASLIGFEDAAGDFTAVDVEAAIVELKAMLDALIAGDVATNTADIATNVADIASTLALIPLETQGTFPVDLVGFVTAEQETVNYRKIGNMVTIFFAQFGATSNTTTFISGATDVPAAIRPASSKMGAFITRDNGTFILGTINVSSAGQISFGSANLSGLGGFTASGDKGYRGNQSFTYSLD